MDKYFQRVRPRFCTLASWVSYTTFHKLGLFSSPGRKGTEGSWSGELVLYIYIYHCSAFKWTEWIIILILFHMKVKIHLVFKMWYMKPKIVVRVQNAGYTVLHSTTTRLPQGWISVLPLIWRAQLLPFYCIFEHTSP